MICVVEGGHGQGLMRPLKACTPSEIVRPGACEMMTGDESWCNLTALEINTCAGVPLIVMAVCGKRKWDVYAFVTSRMVVDDAK